MLKKKGGVKDQAQRFRIFGLLTGIVLPLVIGDNWKHETPGGDKLENLQLHLGQTANIKYDSNPSSSI